jgi:hypothetical protein
LQRFYPVPAIFDGILPKLAFIATAKVLRITSASNPKGISAVGADGIPTPS